MRILAVTLRYPPYVAGGYELLTRDAVQALRERGHYVRVLAGAGSFDEEAGVLPWLTPRLDGTRDLARLSLEGGNAERFRLHVLSPANLAATRRAIRAVRPDVVFFFNLGLVSLAPVVAARMAEVPTLGFVSDPWPRNHWLLDWERNETSRAKSVRLEVLRRFWRGFRALVDLGDLLCCSEWLRGTLLADGLSAERVGVAHLGVAPEMERLARRHEPATRQPEDPLEVACISSFWEGKGQHVLLEGVARARGAGAPVELTLAGTGSGAYLDGLEERARRPDLAGAVTFATDLARPRVSDLLARSHVLSLPSVWGEPFALSTLEGMAHGLAVVVSDTGGSPEALDDGVHGVVVPSEDPGALGEVLVRLAVDEASRRRLATAARERARERFSHAAFVDRLEARLRALA